MQVEWGRMILQSPRAHGSAPLRSAMEGPASENRGAGEDPPLKIYRLIGNKKSGYAVHSTIYHMLCLATYNHFAWHGTTIDGLVHQTVKE